jgi:hypothetical protein
MKIAIYFNKIKERIWLNKIKERIWLNKIKERIWRRSKKSMPGSMDHVSSLSDFQKIIEMERCRVNRNGGSFVIVVFNLEKFQMELNLLSKLVQRISQRSRITDQIGWYDYNRLGVILPETPTLGAQKFIQDLYLQNQNGIPRPPIDLYSYPLQKKSLRTLV